jgi:hypothetical protein
MKQKKTEAVKQTNAGYKGKYTESTVYISHVSKIRNRIKDKLLKIFASLW